MRTGSPRRARRPGFILVAVLFSVMVLLGASTGLAWFVRGQVRQIERERESLTARSLAYIATRQLAAGLAFDSNDYDGLDEPWFGTHVIPVEEIGVAVVSFLPGDDKISLSALFLPDGETLRLEMEQPWRRIWERLERTDLEQVVLDFMDGNVSPRLGGMERETYPNRVPADLSELLTCPGVDEKVLYGDPSRGRPGLVHFLSPWGGNTINVNVAEAEVLTVLDDTFTSDRARTVVEARQRKPFTSMEELKSRGGVADAALPRLSNLLGFKSETFRARVEVQLLSGAQLHYEVVLRKRGKAADILLWKER